MIKKTWIISIVCGLVFSLWSCQTMEQFIRKPTVTFERLDLAHLSLFDATLDFQFNIHNPNVFGATLDRLAYKLAIDEKSVAEGVVNQTIHIGANAGETVSLPVKIDFAELSGSIMELVKKESVAYDLHGAFTVMGVNIPYHVDGRLPIPKLPEISLTQVAVSDMTWSAASLLLRFTLENPNDFPIDMDGLEYAVSLGGISVADGTAKTRASITAEGQTNLDIKMGVNFLQMGQAVGKLIKDQATPYEISGAMIFNLPGRSEKRVPFSRAGMVPMLRDN
jgi:LEA14-like dessication related protein